MRLSSTRQSHIGRLHVISDSTAECLIALGNWTLSSLTRSYCDMSNDAAPFAYNSLFAPSCHSKMIVSWAEWAKCGAIQMKKYR